MKKIIYFIIILMVLGLLISGCQSVIPDEDLSRAPIKAVFEQDGTLNPNINGTVTLNDKNGSITVSLSGALPVHEYYIQLRWSYGGSYQGHSWTTMSTKNGRLRSSENIPEAKLSIWLADQVDIYIQEKDESGYATVLVAHIIR